MECVKDVSLVVRWMRQEGKKGEKFGISDFGFIIEKLGLHKLTNGFFVDGYSFLHSYCLFWIMLN